MRAFSTIGAMASIIGTAPSTAPQRLEEAARRWRERLEGWLEVERDQLVLWLPVGVGFGVTTWLTLPNSALWLAFLATAAGLAIAAMMVAGGTRLGRAVTWFAVAALVGMGLIWSKADRIAGPRLERPQVARFEAVVERTQPQPARDIVRVLLAPDPASGLPPRIRVNIATQDVPPGLDGGARIRLRARLMPPAEAAVPGAYDFAMAAWFAGIGATGRATGPHLHWSMKWHDARIDPILLTGPMT